MTHELPEHRDLEEVLDDHGGAPFAGFDSNGFSDDEQLRRGAASWRSAGLELARSSPPCVNVACRLPSLPRLVDGEGEANGGLPAGGERVGVDVVGPDAPGSRERRGPPGASRRGRSSPIESRSIRGIARAGGCPASTGSASGLVFGFTSTPAGVMTCRSTSKFGVPLQGEDGGRDGLVRDARVPVVGDARLDAEGVSTCVPPLPRRRWPRRAAGGCPGRIVDVEARAEARSRSVSGTERVARADRARPSSPSRGPRGARRPPPRPSSTSPLNDLPDAPGMTFVLLKSTSATVSGGGGPGRAAAPVRVRRRAALPGRSPGDELRARHWHRLAEAAVGLGCPRCTTPTRRRPTRERHRGAHRAARSARSHSCTCRRTVRRCPPGSSARRPPCARRRCG